MTINIKCVFVLMITQYYIEIMLVETQSRLMNDQWLSIWKCSCESMNQNRDKHEYFLLYVPEDERVLDWKKIHWCLSIGLPRCISSEDEMTKSV